MKKKTNTSTYITLLLIFISIFTLSLIFDTTEKPFTILSSIGCGGLASVIVAWLIERSNTKINQNRNKAIINHLLYRFDIYVISECQKALITCAKRLDIDLDKKYTLLEIQTMLNNLDCNNSFFKTFVDNINKGMGSITEITLLNFDQSDFEGKLYYLFLILRTNCKTIKEMSQSNESNEVIKNLIISTFSHINDINVLRENNYTYHISDVEKEYIIRFRESRNSRKTEEDN